MTFARVVIADPCGNVTALVFGADGGEGETATDSECGATATSGGGVDETVAGSGDCQKMDDRRELGELLTRAAAVLLPDASPVEQCGFVKAQDQSEGFGAARLAMFGGEFCCNAARSMVRVLAADGVIPLCGMIAVSGARSLVRYQVTVGDVAVGDGRILSANAATGALGTTWDGTILSREGSDWDAAEIEIEMPLPDGGLHVTRATGPDGLDLRHENAWLVPFCGISHLVVIRGGDSIDMPFPNARTMLTHILETGAYGFSDCEAAGVSIYDAETGMAEFCVRVRNVGTMFDERSCGSGTAAIAAAMARASGEDFSGCVIQPSGDKLSAAAVIIGKESESRIMSVSTSGKVRVLYDGSLTV